MKWAGDLQASRLGRAADDRYTSVIVDTTVWVDYLNGVDTPEVVWFDRESLRQRPGLLDLMVCEILQGRSTDGDAARVFRLLRRFEGRLEICGVRIRLRVCGDWLQKASPSTGAKSLRKQWGGAKETRSVSY